MTLEEALRFIDPETDMDALAEVELHYERNGVGLLREPEHHEGLD